MKRTKAIFDWVYSLDDEYNISYHNVSDLELDENIINARKIREANSVKNVLKLKETINTMQKFHQWLYTEHNAYNNVMCSKDDISEECKNTY